ncbi:MAG: glucose-6-phosphate dehydrogenase [Phycisphaeraceae bacterium]
MSTRTAADSCLLVIFGASGDLTQRKLVPALYEQHREGRLPKGFAVLGVSRSDIGTEGFRKKMRESCIEHTAFDEASWKSFEPLLHYHAGDATKAEAFGPLKQTMCELAAAHNTGDNLLMYLSVAPQLYEPIVNNIGAAGLVTEGQRWCSLDRHTGAWQRLIVEKPFGHDLASAAHLNRVLGRVFEEEAIYRIDHYLGKETVQNLVVFRFANAIFEPLWNHQYVDHVQITAAETVGVEGRGAYYEDAGALRDMIQSHLLQIMAVVAMEPPNTLNAEDLRDEQRKVLQAVRPISADQVSRAALRGQYHGQGNGERVPGYLDEPGVAKDSNTETYAALRLEIDNWRWHGVPFYVRTGKRLRRKLTQICVYFKPAPHSLFRGTSPTAMKPNRLKINVQPDEGISLRFEGKVPGNDLKVRSGVMDFDYVQQFHGQIPEAYGHLLLDAMSGDQSLFKDRHELEAAWRIVMPVLDHWKNHPGSDMHAYPPGSWGPNASETLFQGQGHWHNPEGEQTRWRRDG